MSLFYAKLDDSLISGPCISWTNHHIAVILLGLNEYVTKMLQKEIYILILARWSNKVI